MLKQIFRSLKYKNYRTYFIGQVVSLCGTWVQSVALSWLAYKITGSPILLALVTFSTQIPSIIFTPIAGVLADRVNRRIMLIIIQTIAMFQSGIMAFLTISGLINIYHIIPLSLLLGVLNAMETPVRHSFYTDLLDNIDDRSNAIALNSTMINLTKLIGPAIAGLLIPIIGEGGCFLINTCTFSAIIVSLFMVKTKFIKKNSTSDKILTGMKEGFLYVSNNIALRDILLLISFTSLTGMSVNVLFPIYAKEIYHGGATTLGIILSTFGAGSIVGALHLASRESVLGLTRHIAIATYLMGFAIIIFPLINNFYIALIFIAIAGFGFISMIASCNTVLQTIANDSMRGRVMSFYALSFMGMTPIGSMVLGWGASAIGVIYSTIIAGCLTVICAAVFHLRLEILRSHIKPVYIAKGIL